MPLIGPSFDINASFFSVAGVRRQVRAPGNFDRQPVAAFVLPVPVVAPVPLLFPPLRKPYLICGQKAILSTDPAELYGFEPRALVQAVKRNRERFPENFKHALGLQ